MILVKMRDMFHDRNKEHFIYGADERNPMRGRFLEGTIKDEIRMSPNRTSTFSQHFFQFADRNKKANGKSTHILLDQFEGFIPPHLDEFTVSEILNDSKYRCLIGFGDFDCLRIAGDIVYVWHSTELPFYFPPRKSCGAPLYPDLTTVEGNMLVALETEIQDVHELKNAKNFVDENRETIQAEVEPSFWYREALKKFSMPHPCMFIVGLRIESDTYLFGTHYKKGDVMNLPLYIAFPHKIAHECNKIGQESTREVFDHASRLRLAMPNIVKIREFLANRLLDKRGSVCQVTWRRDWGVTIVSFERGGISTGSFGGVSYTEFASEKKENFWSGSNESSPEDSER